MIFILVLLSSFLFMIPSYAQFSDFEITADPYQWENGTFKEWSTDMIRICITTKERGLIFKITILNENEAEPIEINNLVIDVKVEKEQDSWSFFRQITINYIFIPPKNEHTIFVPIEFSKYGEVIGSYTVELTYGQGTVVEQHIEPYPFDFRVVSEEQFQKEIEQKKTGPLIIIGPWEIKLIDFGVSITIIGVGGAITFFMWKKKRG